MANVTNEAAIRAIIRTAVETYAEAFSLRHLSELDDPEGVINMKINNIFIAALGSDIQYYSALMRSLDSSLGNMLEKMAINIAKLHGIEVAKVKLHSKEWWDGICEMDNGYEVVLEELSSPMALQASRLVLQTWNKNIRKQIA